MKREAGTQRGAFRIDLEGEALWRGDERIHLRTKTWQVLRHLLAHPGVLVTKGQLLEAVWGDVVVSEETLTKSISELRRALDDDPRQPRIIETVHGRGFRLLSPIESSPHGGRAREKRSEGALQPAHLGLDPAPRVFGRQEQLAELERLFERARVGEQQIAFVTGDPGIGKTSLVQSFLAARSAVDSPFWLLSGLCAEQYGTGEPNRPLLDAFEALLRRADSEALIALARRTAPTWLAQIPWAAGAGSDPAGTGHVTEQRMPRELAAFFEALGGSAPVVLVLDDLHWSDTATLDALALLSSQPRGRLSLLVIGMYRPAEAAAHDAPIRRLHRELRWRRSCVDIALEDLSEDAVRALLVDRLGRIAHESTLARLLHEHTDGHPLFLVTMVEHLLERGWLASSSKGWRLVVTKDRVKEAVPSSARQMIERLVESLGPSEQATLCTASLAGLEFDSRAIAAATKAETSDVEAICDALARAGQFVRRLGDSLWPDRSMGTRYAFRHALHRRVFEDQVGAAARREIHQRIGERTEQGFEPDPGPVCNELARHFCASGDGARACRHLELAATRALACFAYRAAASDLERALEHAPWSQEPARTELRLRRRLAVALSAIHGYSAEPVVANLVRARELCQQVEDPVSSLEILYALAFLHFTRADREEAWQTTRELAGIASRSGPVAHVQGLFSLATVAVWGGDHRTAATTFDALFALHHQNSVSPEILAGYGVAPIVAARSNYAYHLWLTGSAEEAQSSSAEAIARARELDNPFTLAGALVHAANLALMMRERERAARLATEAHALACEHGLALWRSASRIGRACAALATVRSPAREIARARAAIAEWEATDSRIYLATAHGFLASALLDTGRPTEGLAAAERGIELAETTLDSMYEAELWRVKGELLLLAGHDGNAAQDCFALAGAIALRQGATALVRRAEESRARLDGASSLAR